MRMQSKKVGAYRAASRKFTLVATHPKGTSATNSDPNARVGERGDT